MKAAVLELERPGKGRFRIADLPQPAPGPDEIVIRLGAASINPIETLMRNGYGDSLFKWMRDKGPRVLGLDGAGVVQAAGSRVQALREGDLVMASNWPYKAGFYAEYVRVPADYVTAVPEGISIADAAAVPYTGLTLCSVLEAAQLDAGNAPGKRVLVHGGSGGIGSILVQLLHRWGCWVATTCSTANVDRVKALGAHRVVDYRSEDFAAVLSDLDVVVNTVAPDPSAKKLDEAPHLSVLRTGGRYVSLISPTLTLADLLGGPPGLLVAGAWMGGARLYWLLRGKHHRWVYYKPTPQRLAAVAGWLESGAVKPLIGGRHTLDQVNEAHARLEQGKAGGKLLLILDEQLAQRRA
ncbi:MAG: NADP-dependent oxidoreductase [Pseudomonadota bacterium]|nr:NADP-dependent oxidoreductase [Pseudomonadota bacterium]